jgi:hypothetical protein
LDLPGVLIYVLRKETSEDRATAIYNLRKAVRAQFADIRNNNVVGKAMWGFVSSLRSNPSSLLLRGNGPGNYAENGRGKRRRKAGQDDSDNEEYRPTPIKNLGKTPKTRSKQQRTS